MIYINLFYHFVFVGRAICVSLCWLSCTNLFRCIFLIKEVATVQIVYKYLFTTFMVFRNKNHVH